MALFTLAFLAALDGVLAYPWVANIPGVDNSLLIKSKAPMKRQTTCPNNPEHLGAAPYSSEYPYTGAKMDCLGPQWVASKFQHLVILHINSLLQETMI